MRHSAGRPGGILLPALAAGLIAIGGRAHADVRALERVPLPRGAGLELVAVDLIQNGRAVSIATFEADAEPAEVLGFYREAWPGRGSGVPGHVVVELGEWTIVSRLEDGVNLALQLAAGEGGRTRGLLSAQRLDAAAVEVPPPAIPPGAELLSGTVSRDGLRRVRTHVVSSAARPGQVVDFYRDAFDRAGWSFESTGEEGESSVLRVTRGGARAELVVTRVPDGTTVAILNEITAGR